MSDHLNGDDFEKVDYASQADQDESVTSTGLTGDIPEEDRYEASTQNAEEQLSEFLSGGNEANEEMSKGEPLMSFGMQNEPEPVKVPPPVSEVRKPSAPPAEPVVTSKPMPSGQGLMGLPGMNTMCCWVKNVDPRVLELIYWRDVKKTGIVFGSMMLILISLACFTLLSVLAYLSLAILTVTLSFRVYKSVMQAVQKTNDGHPFKNLLDVDLQLRSEVVSNAAEKVAANINNLSSELRRLFLVEDYVDSLKFGLLLWLLTYVGSWFSGMTMVILAVVAIFTLPKVYDVYREPIDQNVNLVRAQLNNIMAQVSAKIPFPKKKVKSQ